MIITAKKMMMISLKVNICGLKTPERAISIIPEEKVAPNITPMLATNIVVLNEAMRHPRAELRKLTASLLTPTNRSKEYDFVEGFSARSVRSVNDKIAMLR